MVHSPPPAFNRPVAERFTGLVAATVVTSVLATSNGSA